MATMASAVRDIAATSRRDILTDVAARSVPVTAHTDPLPTPPNSLSPTLPPHGLKAQLMRAKLQSIDSDLDLRYAQEDHTAEEHGAPGSPPYESTGAITSAMLAKYHLPEILTSNGPLAIRHIMGHLAVRVPGFAGIPPAKARRLVVGALEGRGSGAEGAGLEGDVEFEKVSWGVWGVKKRVQTHRDQTSRRGSPNGDRLYPTSIPISKGAGWGVDRTRLAVLNSSVDGRSSLAYSFDDREDIHMWENEADKMSMDGSASASCSEAPDDYDMEMRDDPEDVTDDEDWAAVGAAALRASSYQAPHNPHLSSSVHTGGLRSFSGNAGMARPPKLNFDFSASALGASTDPQDHEAAVALLRLGSL